MFAKLPSVGGSGGHPLRPLVAASAAAPGDTVTQCGARSNLSARRACVFRRCVTKGKGAASWDSQRLLSLATWSKPWSVASASLPSSRRAAKRRAGLQFASSALRTRARVLLKL